MSRFTAIDLSQLPPPEILETLDFEVILAELKQDFKARWEAARAVNDAIPEYDVELLEGDPAVMLLEAAAYREILLRARVNDGAKALLLAYSYGSNLDHLSSIYGVKREDNESDDRLITRTQAAPEAFSTGGPEGAYEFHAINVSPNIRQVAVLTPEEGSGEVHLIPLMNDGDGTPGQEIISAIYRKIAEKDIGLVTDIIVVRAPRVISYLIDVTLYHSSGPSAAALVEESRQNLKAYVASRRVIGADIYEAGIIAAAKVGGVINVISNLNGDVSVAIDEVAFCTEINITTALIGGIP